MFMAAYLTETLNNGIIQDRDEFMTCFGERFFGMELDYPAMINNFCYEPGYSEPLLIELKEKAPRHRDIAEIWYGLNYVDQLLFLLYSCFLHNECMLPTFREGMAPREMTTYWKGYVGKCKEEAEKGLAEIKPLMLKYFPEKMWDEFIRQRFTSKLERAEYWENVIADAAAKWNENLKKLPGAEEKDL